jgi:DNA-directed RNA polymerase specialized sigma24 family protein
MAVMSEPIVEERTETFEDFFHAHHERLLRTMYLATGDRHEAEDLAQEALRPDLRAVGAGPVP